MAAVLALLAPCPAWSGPNAGASLHVDADASTPAIEYSAVGSGSVIRIAIRIRDVRYLDGYSFDLAYDTARLVFLKADPGIPGQANILETRGGSAVAFVGRLSSRDMAQVSVGNALAGSDSTLSPSGGGLLAVLEFQAKAAGMARFTPSNVQLLDYAQELDTAISFIGASVQVGSPVAVRRWAVIGARDDNAGFRFDPLGRTGFSLAKSVSYARALPTDNRSIR